MLEPNMKLKQYYRDQLIRAGVSVIKANQAANNLSQEELYIIGEIWSDWANTLLQVQERYFESHSSVNE